jgi:cbb3-type cytochrome oxidase subunit 1
MLYLTGMLVMAYNTYKTLQSARTDAAGADAQA